MRLAEAADSRGYEDARRRVDAAEAQRRSQLRLFQSVLSRTRQIFVRGREAGAREPTCETWDVRQDSNSPSGWIYREEKYEGQRVLFEFRFAAHSDSVNLTGWLSTSLPTSADERLDVSRGSLCSATTTLLDISAARVKFSDQTWYFSQGACEAASRTPDADHEEFGPNCLRMGR
jgi:hypothetical protein